MDDVKQAFAEGLHAVALAVASFLPRALTMVLVLAFGVALGLLVRFALRRLLSGVDFDRRAHRWGLAGTGEWTPQSSPTAVVGHVAFWAIALVGFLAGLRALETPVTDAITGTALAYLPNLLAAAFILAAGIAGARFLERTTLISAVNMRIQSARLLSLGVKWTIGLLAVALALQQLRVGGAILTVSFAILFGGIVLALALAFGLGSRDAVSRGWVARHEERRAEEETDEIRHM